MQRVRRVGRTIAAQRVNRAEHEARGRSDGMRNVTERDQQGMRDWDRWNHLEAGYGSVCRDLIGSVWRTADLHP